MEEATFGVVAVTYRFECEMSLHVLALFVQGADEIQ